MTAVHFLHSRTRTVPAAAALAASVALGLVLAGCGSATPPAAEQAAATRPSFNEVFSAQTPRFTQLDGVVGTTAGGTSVAPVMIVRVRELTPELRSMIPNEIEGYPVEIEVVGGTTP